MMAGIYDMAKDLGTALARTDEYQALRRAAEAVDNDRELVELRNQLQAVEGRMETALRMGQEPDEEAQQTYQAIAEELQGKAAFQRLVAAQSNFDKVMYKVNETMARGLQDGAKSRIILPS
jgi:cell fate (sporulation/competence/biofilm development) regulator YlbF (YheA/YmcA/DUF963 family)